MEQVNCNLCGSRESRILFYSPDFTFPKEAEKFAVVRCVVCALVFINPRPDKSEISNYYPADYFRCYAETRLETEAIQRRKAKIVGQISKAATILDIGCGRGEFLAEMQERGWEAYGVELSFIAASYAKEKLGLKNIYNADLLAVSLPENFFDVITLWHALEHLADPLATLQKIHSLLKDDGALIINCPNFNSGLRKVFQQKWYQLDLPRHLYQFTPQTLGPMLKKCGFVARGIDYMPLPLHSMIWFKMTIFRWLGLKGFLYSHITEEKRLAKAKSRGMPWLLLRNLFNLICYIFALVLGLLRLGDDMCITAKKLQV